jgi:hypothetical protein
VKFKKSSWEAKPYPKGKKYIPDTVTGVLDIFKN